MGYLALGIIIGILVGKYIFPLLDLINEYINVRVSERASIYQAKVQILQFKLEERCTPKQSAIGFSMDDLESSELFEDEDEDEDKACSKKIGFKC